MLRGDVTFDLFERVYERRHFAFGEDRAQFGVDADSDLCQFVASCFAGGGDEQPGYPAIDRVGASLEETFTSQSVEVADKRRPTDRQSLGEFTLTQSRTFIDMACMFEHEPADETAAVSYHLAVHPLTTAPRSEAEPSPDQFLSAWLGGVERHIVKRTHIVSAEYITSD